MTVDETQARTLKIEKRPEKRAVIDQYGRKYTCRMEDILGSGGQGEVLRCAEDECLAIKFSYAADKKPDSSADGIAAYARGMGAVRNLPLPHGLPLSMPVAMLKSHAGYVMKLLGGMRPLKDLLSPRNEELARTPLPAWLAPDGEGSIDPEHINNFRRTAFYAATGGLTARLRILADLAGALASLHGLGLVFGDLSPNNVLVPKEIQTGEINAWLIDVDNLRPEGRPAAAYTPHYCGPEALPLADASPVALRATDAYSFAIMAFELLTMTYPFEGALAWENDGDIPSDGSYPWIYDAEDRSNSVGEMDPFTSMVLSPPLFHLFDRTFGAGRLKPAVRPKLWEWRSVLLRLADMAVTCPNCGMGSYYANVDESLCPYCDRKMDIFTTAVDGVVIHASHLPASGNITLPRRVFGPVGSSDDGPALLVGRSGEEIYLVPADGASFFLNGAAMSSFYGKNGLPESGATAYLDIPGAWETALNLEKADCDES